jgi:hypothetical protein
MDAVPENVGVTVIVNVPDLVEVKVAVFDGVKVRVLVTVAVGEYVLVGVNCVQLTVPMLSLFSICPPQSNNCI